MADFQKINDNMSTGRFLFCKFMDQRQLQQNKQYYKQLYEVKPVAATESDVYIIIMHMEYKAWQH